MPVWNVRGTLPHAIRSVQWQTNPFWELLVIDDGSTDGTQEIARRFSEADNRIRVFSDGRHLGLAYRLNQAIALSRGNLFARMDGDDVAYPNRLERQSEYLISHSDIDLVGASAVVFGDHGFIMGKRTGPESHEEICAHPYTGFPIIHPLFMGRIEFFRRFGYSIDSILCEDRKRFLRAFSTELNLIRGGMYVEDQELLLRTYKAAKFGNVRDILLGYRAPKLTLRRLLKTRHHCIKSLFYNVAKHGNYLKFLTFSLVNVLKLCVEVIAVLTGLNYRLLRHRAGPISPDEKARWATLWECLEDKTSRTAVI